MATDHRCDGLPLTPAVFPPSSALHVQQNAEHVSAQTAAEKPPQSFHRIADARKRQGMSLQSVAKKLARDVKELRAQERPDSDLRLSDLFRWQAILDVPLSELLDEPDMTSLSPPVMRRAQLLKVMKTVKSILASSKSETVEKMAENLIAQLTEIMPELAEVPAWHTVGQRRSLEEYGKAANPLILGELPGSDVNWQ